MEYRVAETMGGKRSPVSGVAHEDKTDVEHPVYCVSCKLRKSFALWSEFREVEKNAKKTGKIPLLVIKEKGKQGELAIVRLEHLVELAEKAAEQ